MPPARVKIRLPLTDGASGLAESRGEDRKAVARRERPGRPHRGHRQATGPPARAERKQQARLAKSIPAIAATGALAAAQRQYAASVLSLF